MPLYCSSEFNYLNNKYWIELNDNFEFLWAALKRGLNLVIIIQNNLILNNHS